MCAHNNLLSWDFLCLCNFILIFLLANCSSLLNNKTTGSVPTLSTTGNKTGILLIIVVTYHYLWCSLIAAAVPVTMVDDVSGLYSYDDSQVLLHSQPVVISC